jgi:uncharacterized protein (TIGR03067 family)
MRHIILLILFSLTFGCATTKHTEIDLSILNGVWKPIKQEIGGKELPLSLFKNQKLTLIDSSYTLVAESIDKGVVKYNGGKMDIYGKEGVNSGKHFTAIYKIENEQLIICYNLLGDSYPTEFETKSKPTLFLSIFKKD